MGESLTQLSVSQRHQPQNEISKPTEHFELLVFDRYGSLYIQTDTGWYFFATAYWFAAKVLHNLLHGIEVKGIMSYPEHRVLNPIQSPCCLYLDEQTVNAAQLVDLVESDWPGVGEFFGIYRERMAV
ncbi:hypothetical protein AB833_29085 [Chromatiales bacterium (ex Bugula neritina AB1)]|nr:hypothetical protein AB833_29085 [Chromatiales bacterium (ex Bugula neritina AB1)]